MQTIWIGHATDRSVKANQFMVENISLFLYILFEVIFFFFFDLQQFPMTG